MDEIQINFTGLSKYGILNISGKIHKLYYCYIVFIFRIKHPSWFFEKYNLPSQPHNELKFGNNKLYRINGQYIETEIEINQLFDSNEIYYPVELKNKDPYKRSLLRSAKLYKTNIEFVEFTTDDIKIKFINPSNQVVKMSDHHLDELSCPANAKIRKSGRTYYTTTNSVSLTTYKDNSETLDILIDTLPGIYF